MVCRLHDKLSQRENIDNTEVKCETFYNPKPKHNLTHVDMPQMQNCDDESDCVRHVEYFVVLATPTVTLGCLLECGVASIELQSSPGDEAETTVGQTDAEGNLVNRKTPKRTTQAPENELFVHPRRLARATFDVGLGRAARSSEEKCGSIHGTAPNVEEIPADNVGRRPCHGGLASCRLNPKTTSRPPHDGWFLSCIHVLSALFSHTIPCQGTRKHSSGCLALPCLVRALACRRPTCASTCS